MSRRRSSRPAGPRPKGKPTRGRRPPGQRGTTPVRDSQSSDQGGPKGLGGDQVEGRQSVRELLLVGRRRTREVVMSAGLDSAPILDDIIDLADEQKVPIREIGRSKFDALTRTSGSQGVLAFAAPLESVDLEGLTRGSTAPFLLLLDQVTDPGNLGAILRSAECAGVTGVILPRHRSARVTATVTKAAAGAIEHLRFASVAGLPSAMTTLTERGVWTYGLDGAADTSLYDVDPTDQPVALVMGAEGSGLSRLVRERCDVVVRIPMLGSTPSLNVASAAAVALFTVARARTK